MVLTDNKKVWKIMFSLILFLVALFSLFYYFASIFIVFIFGFILIFIAEKSMNFYNSLFVKIKINSYLKKVLGYFLVFFFIGFLFLIISTSVLEISNKLTSSQFGGISFIEIYEQNFKAYLPSSFQALVNNDNIVKIQTELVKFLTSAISNFGGFIFNSLLIIPLLFVVYFNKKEQLIKYFLEVLPKNIHNSTKNILNNISNQMSDYFNAKVIESVIIALILSIGFYFIGLEGWLFLGILAGFLNIVPYLGPILGLIIPLLVAITHSINSVYLVLLMVLIVQLIDNFYLVPFMVADKVKIDSLLSIILILVGAQLYGAFGMIFIIPFYLISKIIIVQIYDELIKIYDKN